MKYAVMLAMLILSGCFPATENKCKDSPWIQDSKISVGKILQIQYLSEETSFYAGTSHIESYAKTIVMCEKATFVLLFPRIFVIGADAFTVKNTCGEKWFYTKNPDSGHVYRMEE